MSEENLKLIDGVEYIQVHPTFLYESIWNLMLVIIILLFTKHKKYDGQLFLIYLAGYGLGRFLIEGLRTDQLLLWNTKIPVSQILALITFICSSIVLIVKALVIRKEAIKKNV